MTSRVNHPFNPRACRLYDVKQERYFNWAGGIRATDRNHQVAQLMFKQMEEAYAKPSLSRRLSGEGMGMAMEVRNRIINVLYGQKQVTPGQERNIILGNSTSLALLPVFYSLAASRVPYSGIFDPSGYAPTLSLLTSRTGKVHLPRAKGYPGMAFDMSERERKWVSENLTTQNFGQDERMGRICRSAPNSHLLDLWSRVRESYPAFCRDSFLVRKSALGYFDPNTPLLIALAKCQSSGSCPLLIQDLIDGWGDPAIGFQDARKNISRFGGLSILDVSHVFGLRPLLPEFQADVLVGSSSKYLAAEPTIGFAYVSDKVLEIVMEHFLRRSPFPRIGFQFHPDVLKEAGCKGSCPGDIERMPLWISLPELESFRYALQSVGDGFGVQIDNRYNLHLLSKALGSFMSSFPGLDLEASDSRTIYSQPSNSTTRTNYRYQSDELDISLFADPLVPFTVITFQMPKPDGFRLSRQTLPWEADAPADAISAGLESHLSRSGYAIRNLSERLTLFDHEDIFDEGLSLRISWSPTIMPDFKGLFETISRYIGAAIRNPPRI